MQTKLHKLSIQGTKWIFMLLKQYCLMHETLVFDSPNNIVWDVKQYCFVRQTTLLAQWNVTVSYLIHSFAFIHLQFIAEGNNCNSIILHNHPVRQHPKQHSTGRFGVQKETHSVRTASKWIWRIAREGASRSPPRILAQRRALWSDSFDRMSLCYFRFRRIPLDASFSSPSFSSDATWTRTEHTKTSEQTESPRPSLPQQGAPLHRASSNRQIEREKPDKQ